MSSTRPTLPTELILYVLSHMSFKDLVNVKQISRYFNTLVSKDLLAHFYIKRRRLKYGYYFFFVRLFSNKEEDILRVLKQKRNYLFPRNRNLLADVVDYGHLNVVKFLVASGVEVDVNYNDNVLLRAATKHLHIIEYFITLGVDIRVRYDFALRWAARNSYWDVVKYLIISGGADVHAGDGTVLKIAVHRNRVDMLTFLIELGADIHFRDDELLCNAVDYQHLKMVQFLVESGADIHTKNERPLANAVSSGCLEMVNYLICLGADIHAGALWWAVKYGQLEMVKYLVSLGVNINTFCEESFPLVRAIQSHSIALDIIKYFVDSGADVHIGNEAPLRWIFENLHLFFHFKDIFEITQLLVSAGADIHFDNEYPFRAAVRENDLGMVKLIMDNGGVNVNANNNEAIRTALENQDLEMVKFLVNAGANIGNKKHSVIRWAIQSKKRYNYREIIQFLMDAGAAIPARIRGIKDIKQYLLDLGVESDRLLSV